MNSKTSFSKGLFKNDIKRFKWMGFAYFLILFFIVPFKMVMINNNPRTNYNMYNYIFNFRNEFQVLLIIGVPILLGVFLLRYLQARRNSDFIHSLPIKRESLYLANITIGFIVLILPVVLNALISIILRYTLGIEVHISLNSIYLWTGITILMNLIIFSITIFSGVITGISTLQGVLSFIFIFLPMGLSYLVIYNLEKFLYGFNLSNINEQILLKLSPIVMILSQNIEEITLLQIVSYSLITFILLVISIYFYKKRHLETATQSFSFDWVKPIFKYGITFSGMTFGGMYFNEIQGDSITWTILGYFIGSVIGYIVAEMIIRKSFSILKYMKGYVVYVIIIAILLVGIKVDIVGYERYVPNVEKVESAHFSNYHYKYGYYDDTRNKENSGLKSKNNIKLVTELHKAIIDNKELNLDEAYTRRMNITYILENGNTVTRGYEINNENYEKYFRPLYESSEYKIYYNNIYNSIFKVKGNEVDKITFRVNYDVNKKVLITDPTEIREVIEILKKDILDETYEEFTDEIPLWSTIEFLQSDNKRFNVAFKKSYENLEKWLKEKGYYENSRIMPEDISSVRIVKAEDREKYNDYENKKMVDVDIDTENIKILKIEDNIKIETLLRNYKELWTNERKYHVEFLDETGRVILNGVLDDYIPDYIEEFFR